MRLEDRGVGLLDLQEERVVVGAAGQQHDPAPGADAADADDLPGGVAVGVALEQLPAAVRRRSRCTSASRCRTVCVELVATDVGEDLLGGHEQRRVADEAQVAVDRLGEAGQGLEPVLGLRLGHVLLELGQHAGLGLGPDPGLERVGVESDRPEVEVGQGGELGHRPSVGAGGHAGTIALHLVGLNPRLRPAISRLAARRCTSHSNGPGRVSSKSLRSKTSWRSGAANPPKLERWASPHSWTPRPVFGVLGEVPGLDGGGSPVEGERRGGHAAVADREQLGDAVAGLVLEDLDRVGPAVGRCPLAERRAGSGLAGCSADGLGVVLGHRWPPGRRGPGR